MSKQLETADWYEIQRVLKETFEIWSPGLSRERYREFIFTQMMHPWCRQNYTYLILRDGSNSKTPAASLKYYKLNFQSRGRTYRFAGFGAIYTRKALRGHGYATELIKLALDRAWYDGCHGAILFSDISPSFYTSFGFFDLNNEKFILTLKDTSRFDFPASSPDWQGGSARDTISSSTSYVVDDDETVVRCRYLTTDPDTIDYVTRHYGRWLRKQPFGFERTRDYFHLKVSRENYLAQFSTLSWPKLELLTVDQPDASGYAIIEYGGRVVRILELVGDDRTRKYLWRGVVARARDLDAVRISGWESVLADFVPGFSISQMSTIDASIASEFASLGFADKVKGRTMVLLFNENLEGWLTLCPCPVLELDHL